MRTIVPGESAPESDQGPALTAAVAHFDQPIVNCPAQFAENSGKEMEMSINGHVILLLIPRHFSPRSCWVPLRRRLLGSPHPFRSS
jgi:hypothetical protein